MDEIKRDDVIGETRRIHCNLQSLLEEIEDMHAPGGEDTVAGGCLRELREELRALQRILESAVDSQADKPEW